MASTPPSPPNTSAFNGCVVAEDILEIMVQDDAGAISFVPAIVWSVCDDGFEVFYVTRCHPNHADPSTRGSQLEWGLEDRFHRVPWQAVNAHVPLAQFDGDKQQQRKRAFKTLGFRDLGSCDRFYKITEEALLETVPTLRLRQVEVGELDSDTDADSLMDSDEEGEAEELDADGNLADLIVPDDEVELFQRALPGTSTFVDDMHTAQTAFTAWQPSNESEQRTKDLLDSLDTRICREEANRAWERGRAF